jgi:hypothetical protein
MRLRRPAVNATLVERERTCSSGNGREHMKGIGVMLIVAGAGLT